MRGHAWGPFVCTSLLTLLPFCWHGSQVKHHRGVILNIGSGAGRIPIGNPLYAVYSASKAYVDFLSRSMAVELKPLGVTVQCQAPYMVTSKLSKIRHSSLFVPSPDTFVASSLKALCDGSSVVPFWSHKLQDWLMQNLPTWAVKAILVKMHLGLRRRFLRKLESKKSN
jgi:17beta-estradiol 17-dehydrogenase / very-long-chain 3-oxoacyl-CoA reductase